MPQVKLNNICNREPMVGKPGQVIEVTEEQAAWLFEIEGATPWPQDEAQPELEDPLPDSGDVDNQDDNQPTDPSLEDLGITTKKQGRDALEANGIYSLGDYDAMLEAEEQLTNLEGITPGKAAIIEEKIEDYRKAHPQTATERPGETATERG